MSATTVRLGRGDVPFLAAHLARQAGWDTSATVRLVTHPRALGCYAAPPLGVVTFVALPLADPWEGEPLDVTCSAVALRDAVTAAAASDHDDAVDVTVPAPVPAAADLVDLPPGEGWQLPIHGVSGDLVPLVDEAVAEFRVRARANPGMADSIAAEIWDRPAWAGLPLRVLHCARLLGLLPQDGARVAAATAGSWKRLTTSRGQVFVHGERPRGRLILLTSP